METTKDSKLERCLSMLIPFYTGVHEVVEKTDAGLAWLIEPQYLDNPQYRALVLRRNYDDLRDWIDRAKFFYRFLDVQTVGNPTEFRFPSGAKFRTGHLSEDTAFQKYLGHQYHKLLIEEVTLIPNELDYERVTSSVRSFTRKCPYNFSNN